MKQLITLSKTLLLVSFLLAITGSYAQQSNTIFFDKNKQDGTCGSGFTISSKIEADPYYKKELEKYLYKCFIDDAPCDSIPAVLFTRKSFTAIVMEVYTQDYFLKYSIYDYESRWKESYINLLYYCTNDTVFYTLCDTLLKQNNDDGLIAVWTKDARKLKNLKQFEKASKDNPYLLTELAAVYHNSGMPANEAATLKQLKKTGPEQFNILSPLLLKGTKIDYADFMEAVFGGM